MQGRGQKPINGERIFLHYELDSVDLSKQRSEFRTPGLRSLMCFESRFSIHSEDFSTSKQTE